MDEQFYDNKRLPSATVQPLMQRCNHPAIAHFLVLNLLFFAASSWVVLSWTRSWWEIVFAQITFGTLCCGQFACLHEVAHGTAFQSKRLNQIAATFAGVMHLYPAVLFRELHFTHHRHTHVPGLDPEISFGGKPVPSVVSNLPMYLGWLTGAPLILVKLLMLILGALGMPEFARLRLFPFVRPKVRFALAMDCWLVLSVYVGLTLLAVFVHPGFWGLWVGQLVGHLLLASYLAAEHNGLPHEGDILARTRSIRASRWVKWLMWNMPYHAEHHAYPAVPFHALPKLHNEMEEVLQHQDESHPQFHYSVVRKLLKL